MRPGPRSDPHRSSVEFQEAIRRASILVVAILRASQTPEPQVRTLAVRGLREAIEGAEALSPFTVLMPDGPTTVCGPADLFRLTLDDFGVDRADLAVQEVVFAQALQQIDEILAVGPAR